MKSSSSSKSVAAGGALLGVSGVASARERYPAVDNPYDDATVKEMSIEWAKQPHHDRVAFTTSVFGGGRELYLATEAASVLDTPDDVLQTDSSGFGVFGLDWKKGNRLSYWQDGTVYKLKIPLSNKMFTPREIEESAFPEGYNKIGGGS